MSRYSLYGPMFEETMMKRWRIGVTPKQQHPQKTYHTDKAKERKRVKKTKL
jgi:hypothetical protein